MSNLKLLYNQNKFLHNVVDYLSCYFTYTHFERSINNKYHFIILHVLFVFNTLCIWYTIEIIGNYMCMGIIMKITVFVIYTVYIIYSLVNRFITSTKESLKNSTKKWYITKLNLLLLLVLQQSGVCPWTSFDLKILHWVQIYVPYLKYNFVY